MRIKVKLFASLIAYMPEAEAGIPFDFDLSDCSSITELMALLNLPDKEVRMAFVNGRIESNNFRLKNGDEVGIFPLIGGG